MVSACEKRLKNYSPDEFPFLEAPKYVRLKFIKVGNLQYISHLDLQKSMGRILRRAGIPLWYSKGFSPHPKLIFATPLSVGAQSLCELIDIRVERDIPPSVMMERLNRELTDEMYFVDAYYPETKFTDIEWAEYVITIKSEGANEGSKDKLLETLSSSPLMITKKTKSGMKDIDINPLIKNTEAEFSDGVITLKATLSVNGERYLNPEQIINVIKDRLGVLSGDPMKEEYTITRQRVLLSDGREFR